MSSGELLTGITLRMLCGRDRKGDEALGLSYMPALAIVKVESLFSRKGWDGAPLRSHMTQK
jgi:hypothetical protein